MVAPECASPLSAGGQWQGLLRNIATGVRRRWRRHLSGRRAGGARLQHRADDRRRRQFRRQGHVHASHGFVERLASTLSRRGRVGPRNRRGAANTGSGRSRTRRSSRWRGPRWTSWRIGRNRSRWRRPRSTPTAHRAYPSASCGESRGMIDAVRCADRLIAEFIEDMRNTHPDIRRGVVHGSPHGQTLASTTRSSDTSCPTPKKRRLRFVAWGPDIRPGVIDRRHPIRRDADADGLLGTERMDRTLPWS